MACRSQQINQITNTEGGRIALVLQNAAQCASVVALEKARIFGRSSACASIARTSGSIVPASSAILARATTCLTTVSSATCVPESTRIRRVQAHLLNASIQPLDPDTRFSEFNRRPLPPPVCPPIPQEFLNANVPKNQMRNCPLPNKPDNPVLPG